MSIKGTIGEPVSRLEGELKVTGDARYAGDYPAADLLYGYVVNSVITKGTIEKMDTSRALAVPGVVKVFTHENKPSLAWFDFKYADMDAPPGSVFKPLHDDKILYNGQPIALVVADTFEAARFAATLVQVVYKEESFSTNIHDNAGKARDPKKGLATLLKPPPPKPQGDFDQAFSGAAAQVTAHIEHGTEHHNPMELFATTTVYEGKGKLTIYDKTQGTVNSQLYVCNVFGLKFKNVRVVSPYVGGAFGSVVAAAVPAVYVRDGSA
ncbi:xanthine dehydrogenase family protein molybdopterin-binding subunit [Dyadobacter sandarakinus]|uniref:xanthine dehydrogenase family protein molybdopterin-binding subunit n=1 Tax=Dyadobacter sandarakinus TaxID=2747268 RepID=UPI00286E54ED|nr:molybdopterin cofactor-binding domain-containing protein [Dyadobacter sandarakinus]